MRAAAATQRSYGLALLRWFRFVWATGMSWDQATRVEGRDFCRWVQVAGKPVRPHWRQAVDKAAELPAAARPGTPAPGTPNPVTGKATPGRTYAVATRAHSETVLRSFYDFHLEAGSGPMVNPFPLSRDRRGGRGNSHHNPMEPYRDERRGRYRPKVVGRVPRCIPDETFNELFARLLSHRDRALVAFWVSTGARASELLGATGGDADPGQQLITVIRKGNAVHAAAAGVPGCVRVAAVVSGADGWAGAQRAGSAVVVDASAALPPAHLHAAYRMFARVNAALGANWTPHDLRHTAAYRMTRDPAMPLTDVQWVLGHAQLTTTQLYVNPLTEDVVASVLAFHERRGEHDGGPPPGTVPGYRPESLKVLFGADPR